MTLTYTVSCNTFYNVINISDQTRTTNVNMWHK